MKTRILHILCPILCFCLLLSIPMQALAKDMEVTNSQSAETTYYEESTTETIEKNRNQKMNDFDFFIESLVADLIIVSIFAIPVLVIAFFIFSLVRFILALVKRKKAPGDYPKGKLTSSIILLAVSAVILTVLLTVVIGFTVLLYLAVAYM